MRVAVFVCVSATGALTGCANYRAVSQFGEDTTAMTFVVRREFTELQTLCVQQAQLVLVVNNIDDDQALAQCEKDKGAQGEFARITIDVLDNYAGKLKALADDKPFDLSPSVQDAAAKVRALKDRDGNAVIPAADVEAVSKIARFLVDVVSTVKRDEAVKAMVDASPDLEAMGRSLKSFFVSPPGTTTKAPYVSLVIVMDGSATSTQRMLSSGGFHKAEPIRTAELLRELRVRQAALKQRLGTSPGSVPVKIGAAIDAWIAALRQFAIDAKKPDSQELIDRLKRLRDATRDASS
jgi:hypothetical protein